MKCWDVMRLSVCRATPSQPHLAPQPSGKAAEEETQSNCTSLKPEVFDNGIETFEILLGDLLAIIDQKSGMYRMVSISLHFH